MGSVAVLGASGVESALEPVGPLLRRTVRERLGIDRAAGHPLNAIVANRCGSVETFIDIAALEDVALRGGVAPDAGVTVSLQLERHALAHVRSRQLLHVMSELVRDHVRLGEISLRAELVPQFLEESE